MKYIKFQGDQISYIVKIEIRIILITFKLRNCLYAIKTIIAKRGLHEDIHKYLHILKHNAYEVLRQGRECLEGNRYV